MKTLQLAIVILFSFVFLFSMYVTTNFQAFADGWIPVEYYNTTMRISIQSFPDSLNTNTPQDRDVHLKFFDAKTGNTVENMTFYMKVIAENKILLSNVFWTKSGDFAFHLKFGNNYLWNANPDHDPMDGRYYSKGDQIDIDASYLSGGPYSIEIQPLVYIVGNTIQQHDGLKFAADLDLLGVENKTIMPNLNVKNEIKIESPATQFREGIIAQDVICKEGFQLIIKTEGGSPQCVSTTSQSKLISRGWAESPNQSSLRLWYKGCSWSYSTGNTVCIEASKPIRKSPVIFNMTTTIHGIITDVSILQSHAFCAILSHDKIKFNFNSTFPINFTVYAMDETMPDPNISCNKNGRIIMGFENTRNHSDELNVQDQRLFTFVFDVDKPTPAIVNFAYSKRLD